MFDNPRISAVLGRSSRESLNVVAVAEFPVFRSVRY
jgi:hypothetical protein